MDKWKFYDITHREHTLCNPTSMIKLQRLISLLRLPPDAHVLDIASGKGDFIIRLAERYGASGVAVDLSPYVIAEATAKMRDRPGDVNVTFLEMDAADYRPAGSESFDLTSCLGASWVYGGYYGALKALASMTKPAGLVVVGEPHWLREPDLSFLTEAEITREMYGTLYDNVFVGSDLGLTSIYTIASNQDDWDHYYGLWTYAANNYAMGHPDDPDVAVLLERVAEELQQYYRWGRNTLGWAIHVFRKSTD